MTINNPLVELQNVQFGYGDRIIHKDISFSVPKGSVTILMGPSGSGKSTILSFIGGRIKPNKGKVIFGDACVNELKRREIFELRKKMGMMFQHNALLTDLNVYNNVAYPLRENTRLSERLIEHIVNMKLNMVGLRNAKYLYPKELSGGMARRVALARAIALDPELVMYDEPFTGLDPIALGVAVKLIQDLNRALGITSLVVTHDISEGMSIADWMVLIGNDGKVMAEGKPDDLNQSLNPNVRQFMDGDPDGPVSFDYPGLDWRTELYEGRS